MTEPKKERARSDRASGRTRNARLAQTAREGTLGVMGGLGATTGIYLVAGATDLRKGCNSLFALARARWDREVLGGDLFLFCNRRQDALKIFFWSEGARWVCAARLDRGTYRWPGDAALAVTMTAGELQRLLSGIDPAGARRRVRWRKKVQ
jgi:transposase